MRDVAQNVVATIHGESLLENKFVITLADGRSYHYSRESAWKGIGLCEGEGGPFLLYEHTGVRYSIFQQDTQVAAFSRKGVVVGNNNTYDLEVNASADLVLIACIVLCLNTARGDRNSNTVTYDLGNFGSQQRAFDENWRANNTVAGCVLKAPAS